MKKKKTVTKVPVTKTALISRINRRLEPKGLHIYRTTVSARTLLGDYYIADRLARDAYKTKARTRYGTADSYLMPVADLEKYARREGVLKKWECLMD